MFLQLIFENNCKKLFTKNHRRLYNEAKEMGINKRFKIAETNTLTYGTRAIVESAKIELYLRAKKVYLAAYPCSDNEQVIRSV